MRKTKRRLLSDGESFEAYQTKIELNTPITDLSRLIAEKWHLPLWKLAERCGCSVGTIYLILRGKHLKQASENVKKYLEQYEGECV